MKFFNTVTSINLTNHNYTILDNSNNTQAAIIITLQLINKDNQQINVLFKRQKYINENWETTPYQSSINIKTGTTIVDHIVVINPQQRYIVSSNSNLLVVSCSYGI